MSWSRPAVTATAALLLTTTACAGDGGEVIVPADDVAARIIESVTEDVGIVPEVTCPGDLPGEVGATLECEMLLGESAATALVTVTEVTADDEVYFDISIDEVTDAPDAEESPSDQGGGEETPGVERLPVPGDGGETPTEGPLPDPGDPIPGTPVPPTPVIPIPSVDQPA